MDEPRPLRAWRVVGGIAATCLVLTALLFVTLAHAQQGPPKWAIGVAVPTTGEYAPLGKQLVQAAQLAAAETRIRIIVADTEGDPARAVKAIEELASDESVVAIVGPIGQRESRAAASAAQRFGVPLFSLSTSENVNRAGGWVFRVRSSPGEQGRAMARLARGQLESKSVAVMYPKTPYGNDAAVAFADEYLRLGGRVAAVANYPEDMTDYTDVLEVLVGKKVYLGKKGTVGKWRTNASGFARTRRRATVDFDALFIPDFHQRVARILPFLPVAGIQNGNGGDGVAVQLLGLAGWQGKSMELAGGVAAGALYLDTFAGESAGGRPEEFSRTFFETTGRRPVDVEAETFDITWLLGSVTPAAAAASTATPNVRANIIRKLPRSGWSGVAGPLGFDRDGAPLRKPGVYRFDGDGFVAPAY